MGHETDLILLPYLPFSALPLKILVSPQAVFQNPFQILHQCSFRQCSYGAYICLGQCFQIIAVESLHFGVVKYRGFIYLRIRGSNAGFRFALVALRLLHPLHIHHHLFAQNVLGNTFGDVMLRVYFQKDTMPLFRSFNISFFEQQQHSRLVIIHHFANMEDFAFRVQILKQQTLAHQTPGGSRVLFFLYQQV